MFTYTLEFYFTQFIIFHFNDFKVNTEKFGVLQ